MTSETVADLQLATTLDPAPPGNVPVDDVHLRKEVDEFHRRVSDRVCNFENSGTTTVFHLTTDGVIEHRHAVDGLDEVDPTG